jgi:1-acyl-sn-glycerol-3-phosphate acyltransferase
MAGNDTATQIGRTGPRPARTVTSHATGRLAAVRASISAGVLLAAGFAGLGYYRLGAQLRGPSAERAAGMLQRWYQWAWPWLRLHVSVQGAPPPCPCVYVANHRSYLDIAVLSGVLGGTFLSRADVADWPLVGPVARAIDAVLVARDDPRDRARAARALIRRVRTLSVIVFPEGTTTGERLPGAFEPGLFRLLRRLDAPVIPVTIRYSDRRAYWIDDVTVGQHLRGCVLAGSPLAVAVHIGQPVSGSDADELARAVRAAIGGPIEEFGELVKT